MPIARQIRQPGPAAAERIASAEGRVRQIDFTLEPGLTLNAAIARPLLAAGCEAAAVELEGGAFGPFVYVMPAAATDAVHAAWYSAPYAPRGETVLERGCVTFGRRDDAPFLHCHAFWTEPDGARRGGHVMPHEALVARPIRARAYGAAEAGIRARPCAETNFTLFAPETLASPWAAPVAAPAAEGPRIAFGRVRPNADISHAFEDLCRRHGFAAGRVRGGVGSLIGARFTDGEAVDDYATEVFIRDGRVAPGADGALEAVLDVSLVTFTGRLAEGRLARGDNPVLITFEVALEEIPA